MSTAFEVGLATELVLAGGADGYKTAKAMGLLSKNSATDLPEVTLAKQYFNVGDRVVIATRGHAGKKDIFNHYTAEDVPNECGFHTGVVTGFNNSTGLYDGHRFPVKVATDKAGEYEYGIAQIWHIADYKQQLIFFALKDHEAAKMIDLLCNDEVCFEVDQKWYVSQFNIKKSELSIIKAYMEEYCMGELTPVADPRPAYQ